MQCCFPSKVDVRSLVCDPTGRFVALTFVDGSGELHALNIDSQLVKTSTTDDFAFALVREEVPQRDSNGSSPTKHDMLEATVAISMTAMEHRGVSLQAWECLPVIEERTRSVFRAATVNILGDPCSTQAQRENRLLAFNVPWCSCTATTNFLAVAGPNRVAIVAMRLRTRLQPTHSRTRLGNPPSSQPNELQLAWVSTIRMGNPVACVLATPSYLFVAEEERILFYKAEKLLNRSAEPQGDIPAKACMLPWGEKSDLIPGEMKIACMHGAGANRVLVQDTQGAMYLVKLVKSGSSKSREADVTRLNFLFRVAFFSVLPSNSGKYDKDDDLRGWKILVCDSMHVLHLIGTANLLEPLLEEGAPILPEKSLMPGGIVMALCGVNASSFLVAFPSQVGHISLA
ncbi:hypothetical protein BSKO_00198 [Bryopsis sp. KO-2023]|nr:hypothetical protein BSKO_00198 [Bryopsis sp. KO-2023]